MKRMIRSSINDTFSIKYDNNIYDDAWEDSMGHIYFGKNKYEYVPKSIIAPRPYVIEKGDIPTSYGYETSHRKHYGEVEIL